jgi:hypothetical protein
MSLFYGRETWTINNRDCQKMETAKIRFLQPLVGLNVLDS